MTTPADDAAELAALDALLATAIDTPDGQGALPPSTPPPMDTAPAASPVDAAAPPPPVAAAPPAPPVTVAPTPTNGEAAPTVDAPAPPPPLDPEELRLELEELRLTLAEAQLSRDREAGRRGSMEQKLRTLEERLNAPPARPDDDIDDARPRVPVPPPSTTAPRPGILTWAINSAVEKAATDFRDTHSDLADLQTPFTERLTARAGEFNRLVTESDDPVEVYREVKSMYDEAYTGARRATVAAQRVAYTTRRAAQVANLDALKARTAASSPGVTAPPPPAARAAGDLSIDEADAWLKQLPPP